ncbi:MAG TPA: hypothetical protein VNA68_02825 [Candidatus Dormibacteraeota bacterium]|nr:hypothetical protein [Candidatus Dormibacteraeota bacterium]
MAENQPQPNHGEFQQPNAEILPDLEDKKSLFRDAEASMASYIGGAQSAIRAETDGDHRAIRDEQEPENVAAVNWKLSLGELKNQYERRGQHPDEDEFRRKLLKVVLSATRKVQDELALMEAPEEKLTPPKQFEQFTQEEWRELEPYYYPLPEENEKAAA